MEDDSTSNSNGHHPASPPKLSNCKQEELLHEPLFIILHATLAQPSTEEEDQGDDPGSIEVATPMQLDECDA